MASRRSAWQVTRSVMEYGHLRHRLGSVRAFESFVSGNLVTLLHDGEQAFPSMLEAIEEARSEILLEMYWFGSDHTGTAFANALAEKARAGVLVRIVYDAVGSWETSRALFDQMRDAGCEVEEYGPIAPWRRRFRVDFLNHRNHRKMLIIDRRVGFTGGVNLGDPWAPVDQGGEGWRDDMVRIEGPAVEQMRAIFKDGWKRVIDPNIPNRPSIVPPAGDDFPDDASSKVRVLANHYFGERRAIRRAYLEQIRSAKRSVYITNSYFVPDFRIRRALSQAAQSGVDVRVVLPAKTDVPAVYYAARNLYGLLLESGIRLYEWQGRVLHAKTAVIDANWCTIGTYNLDYRSFRFNLEVTAAIEDEEVGAAMEKRFFEDLAHAPAVDLVAWRRRPMRDRLVENFFYRFRKML